MTTLEIGKKLVELGKQGKFKEIEEALYAESIVSVEAFAPPGRSAEVRGIAAVREKGEQWQANHTVHSFEFNGPWPNGDKFIVWMKFDVTNKPQNQRIVMEEAGLYTVENGKIVREEFFYAM